MTTVTTTTEPSGTATGGAAGAGGAGGAGGAAGAGDEGPNTTTGEGPNTTTGEGSNNSASGGGNASPTPTSSTSSITIRTSTPTSTPTPGANGGSQIEAPSGKGGVSTGALAGAAVGCALGGLLLGILAAVLFFGWKRGRDSRSKERGQITELHRIPETKLYGSDIPKTHGPDGDLVLDHFLLDGAPDNEIVMEMRALNDLIHQHVENHYFLNPTRADVSVLSQSLVNLGFARKSEAIAAFCREPRTRYSGLRHVISQVVFRNLDVNSPSSLSLLPSPVAGFTQSMPSLSSRNKSTEAMSLALSKWRQLSALLLHPSPLERTSLPASEATVSQQAQALAAALNAFLQHFVRPDDASHHEQAAHLHAVILECTKLGYNLFSQPSDWEFVYDGAPGNQGRTLVVCPGLNKRTYGDGGRYQAPRRVLEPAEA